MSEKLNDLQSVIDDCGRCGRLALIDLEKINPKAMLKTSNAQFIIECSYCENKIVNNDAIEVVLEWNKKQRKML